MNSFRIKVPASSGNVGPGFDSMGLGLGLYLTLDVKGAREWELLEQSHSQASLHEDHFIVKIAKQIAARHHKVLPPLNIVEKSEIPLARGLGSSASAILAGIEVANQACNLNLSNDEMLAYGTELEGHPDNVAPALFGGLVISTVFEDEITYMQIQDLDLDIVVYIPNVELKTETARNVLPDSYPRDIAARASGISNLAVAALLKGDYKLAGKMMEEDLFHEPYRAKLIPNYAFIRQEAKKYGAYGTIISGAGPTMLTIAPTGSGQAITEKMKEVLPDYQVKALQVDKEGIQVEVF